MPIALPLIQRTVWRYIMRPSPGTGQRGAIMVEALPLATHMHHANRGVLCLYCCLDKSDIHRGFWAHAIPQLETLWIPPQRVVELGYWYNRILPPIFPGVAFANAPTRGSNDPFVIIHESVVVTLPSWQHLFEQEWTKWKLNGNSAWDREEISNDEFV